ncbi:MAG: hypothetical protein EBZ59_11910 [Planctomycetia bacterium]|nr:hypothetical protein [Planctomycetia bacterium]
MSQSQSRLCECAINAAREAAAGRTDVETARRVYVGAKRVHRGGGAVRGCGVSPAAQGQEVAFLRCLDVGHLAVTLEPVADPTDIDMNGATFAVIVRYAAGGWAVVTLAADEAHGIGAWTRNVSDFIAGRGLETPGQDESGAPYVEGRAWDDGDPCEMPMLEM